MNQNFYYFWDRIIKMNSNNMKSLNIALIITLFLSIFACNNPNDEIVVVPGTQAAKERTIILYLSGEEYKISRWIGDNIDLICENLNSSVDSEKVNIIAFVDVAINAQVIYINGGNAEDATGNAAHSETVCK